MITKQEYNAIRKAWPVQKRDGKLLEPYQHWKRLNFRLRYFCKYIDLFKGHDVVELGCNAGMYGYEISKVSTSYTGVDISERFIAEANVTKTFMENKNVYFVCSSVKEWCRKRRAAKLAGEAIPEYTALFASFALYHLSDKELAILETDILPSCQLVVIQTRTAKRKAMSNHNSWKFWKPKQVAAFLARSGFESEVVMGPPKPGNASNGPNFAEIIARRKTNVGEG